MFSISLSLPLPSRSVALAHLLGVCFRRTQRFMVQVRHASAQQWGRQSCGLGNGCHDCESEDGKAPLYDIAWSHFQEVAAQVEADWVSQ